MFRISKAAARRLGIGADKSVCGVPSRPALPSVPKAKPVLVVSHLPEPTGVIEIEIHGRPMAKEASRVRNGTFYKPRKTGGFEDQVADEAGLAMRGHRPFSGPVAVEIVQYRRIPKGLNQAQRAAALAGTLLPDTKPDVDNLQKSLFDGLKKVVFEDDAQVCQQSFSKRFGESDRAFVRIYPLPASGIRRR